MASWKLHTVLEGERHSVTIGRGFMMVTCDDYRDDPSYVDPAQEAMWDEIQGEASRDVMGEARLALEVIPDVSVQAVADAYGLSVFQVMPLAKGCKSRNKAKLRGASKGEEFTSLSAEEIRQAVRYARGEWL